MMRSFCITKTFRETFILAETIKDDGNTKASESKTDDDLGLLHEGRKKSKSEQT